MAVYKRGKVWHYRFMVGGKDYFGSTKMTNHHDAEVFERSVLTDVQQTLRATAPAEATRKVGEIVQRKLSGGDRITLAGAYDRFAAQPAKRTRCAARDKANRSRWNDFLAFMTATHPDMVNMADVTQAAANDYIGHLEQHGRFQKETSFTRTLKGRKTEGNRQVYRYEQQITRLSDAARNDFVRTCRMVFDRLMPADLAIRDNPFAKGRIDLRTERAQDRDAFEVADIVKLYQAACSDRESEIIRPLIAMGAGLAMREGDIATLKWEHVRFQTPEIVKATEKTGRTQAIPLWDPAIVRFLEECRTAAPDAKGSDPCFPALALLYRDNRSGVGYRFKRFLADNGFDAAKATRKVLDREGKPKRTRAVSVLDVHSLRHTFASVAGAAGVPFKTVQMVLGHATKEMTERYWRHANNRELREKLTSMPAMFNGAAEGQKALPPHDSKGMTEAELRARVGQLAGSAGVDVLRRMVEAAEAKG
jgi:integrase